MIDYPTLVHNISGSFLSFSIQSIFYEVTTEEICCWISCLIVEKSILASLMRIHIKKGDKEFRFSLNHDESRRISEAEP